MSLVDRLVRALYRHRDDTVSQLEADLHMANRLVEEQSEQLGRQTRRIKRAVEILQSPAVPMDAVKAALRVLAGDGDSRG